MEDRRSKTSGLVRKEVKVEEEEERECGAEIKKKERKKEGTHFNRKLRTRLPRWKNRENRQWKHKCETPWKE